MNFSSPTPLLLVAIVLAMIAALAWWLRQRQQPAPSAQPLAESDRFAAVAALSPVQLDLLAYLYRAFPGRPVLVRAALTQLVSVRAAQDRLSAQRRLADHLVDFVVCTREGRAVYAFELDAAHDDPDQAASDAQEKNRVLKSAGIRLVRLKRSAQQMPAPDEFRRQLRTAELPPAGVAPTAQPRAPVMEDRLHEADRATPAFSDTAPMTLTDLMALPPVPSDSYDKLHADRRA